MAELQIKLETEEKSKQFYISKSKELEKEYEDQLQKLRIKT